MTVIAVVVVSLVAALHAYFMLLEMVLWTKPAGRRAFGLTAEFAESTKSLAANQGLYNGFLVAGLVWAAIAMSMGAQIAFPIACFFLVCVVVAGVFGAITVSRKILFVQAAPALFGLAFVLLAHAR